MGSMEVDMGTTRSKDRKTETFAGALTAMKSGYKVTRVSHQADVFWLDGSRFMVDMLNGPIEVDFFAGEILADDWIVL